MCEVQGPGGAPGMSAGGGGGGGGGGGATTTPERLSVSSSESDEDQKVPRHSLLGPSEDGLRKESPEGTTNSRDLSGEEEEEEEEKKEKGAASEVPEVTVNIMEQKEADEKNEDEEKIDATEMIKDEVEEMKEKGMKVENAEEKEEEKEKEHEESESEAMKVRGCADDDTEKENQENERRDELLENTVKIENEMMEEKTTHDSEEENRRGNDEGPSVPDCPKEEEPRRQKEEEEEERKNDKQQEEEEQETSKKTHEDEKKTKKKEEKIKEIVKEKKEEEEKEEGVDPFSPKCTKEAPPTTTKVSKTVNFLESELKAISEKKRHTINSYSSSRSKEAGDAEEDDMLERLEADEKASKHWTLGDGNPVYRLSLKLSPNLFNTTDIPGPNQHKEADKAGFLTKLSGRSFPYIAQWKRRYCVLSKGRLYYYEKEDSKAGDKSNGVIQLEYFDQVAEAGPKECKKATNVFIITSQDRSFFDPGRHVFSADTLPDMKDWIRKLQAALDQIRNNNRPAASTSPSASPSAKEGGGKRRREEAAENKEGKGSQTQTTNTTTTSKERRKKKEESSRPRKSSKTGTSSQTQTSMVEPLTSETDGGRPAMAIPKGGVMLPGFTSRKDPEPTNRAAERRSGDGEAEEDLPQAGPTLSCVTKQRVKGPSGRRAPQNRRKAAAALKKRASSLSALEHQDASDNRSESSEGATRSYRDSQTPEGDLKEETESEEEIERKKVRKEAIEEEKKKVEKEAIIEEERLVENSPERQFTFDNIDDGLFFKEGLKDMSAGKGGPKGQGQRKRRSSTLKVNFEESPSSPSKNGTLGRFLRIRDSFVTPKRNKFVAKEGLVADHPDMVSNSRWSCAIL